MPTKVKAGDMRPQANNGLKSQEAGPAAKLTLTGAFTKSTALLMP